ncbi:hypothetical protein [Nonomuraea sp. NPDC001831]|uniref:hypothetical protein n=1 Tax=Nonomuraea sp. NPDC001831 TaxID=3364340 RepID=UPI00369A9E19
MDLHPREAVQQYLQCYGDHLSIVRDLLDASIQDAAAYWEEEIPNFRDMDPCSRASHIRQYFSANWRSPNDLKHVLKLEVRFNNGLHLFAPNDVRMRIKTRPKNPKNGLPLDVTEWVVQEDLFGNEVGSGPYEFAVLWTIDFNASALGTATLAAVDFGQDDNGPAIIYHEEEIPQLSTARGSRDNDDARDIHSESAGPGTDDFNEFLEDDGEGYGQDPA